MARIPVVLAFLIFAISSGAYQQPRTFSSFAASSIKPTSRPHQSDRSLRRTGSISGRVVSDSGEPLSNVAVFVRKSRATSSSPQLLLTDEDGRFRLDELSAGAYSVLANLPGYVEPEDSRDRKYYRIGEAITIRLAKGGVITGTLTNPVGEPVVGARVFAHRVRDSQGHRLTPLGGPSAYSDDRGVYRIYGLLSGRYLVGVNADGQRPYSAYAYDGDVPVYYPSSTRDTAAEVEVQLGLETTGIDIRYRSEPGHAISGTITGAIGSDKTPTTVFVSLLNSDARAYQASAPITGTGTPRAFALYGIPDGEYQILAQAAVIEGGAASTPRRVIVRGSDVTGVELSLTPLGSIKGRLALEFLRDSERGPECAPKSPFAFEESIIQARRQRTAEKEMLTGILNPALADSTPDDKGEFGVYRLTAGRYRLEPTLLNEDWFVRSITVPGGGSGKSPVDVSKDGIGINAGQQISNVVVTLAEGAASVRGKVVAAAEGAGLPAKLRIHFLPAEPESADNVIRFAEAPVDYEGRFSVANLAPGRYLILARAMSEEEGLERVPNPLAWDLAARMKLRRDAEAANNVVELRRCQRVPDYPLKYNSPAAPARRPGRRSPGA